MPFKAQMRKIIFFILILSSTAFGSPQAPDFLIVENDTIPIFFLPLEPYLVEHESNFINQLRNNLNRPISFNCWRGYQAIWKLDNDKLYLTDFKSCGIKEFEDPQNVLKTAFPDQYKNESVFAYWVSTSIAIPKGDFLKWDGVFGRTYESEQLFHFKKGLMENTEIIQNYVDLENGFSRLNDSLVTDAMYQKIKLLNWDKLGEKFCDEDYEVTINSKGKISKVRFTNYGESKWEYFWYSFSERKCRRAIQRQLKGMQFDIIKWNGKPYEETFWLQLFYDDETNELENWSEY